MARNVECHSKKKKKGKRKKKKEKKKKKKKEKKTGQVKKSIVRGTKTYWKLTVYERVKVPKNYYKFPCFLDIYTYIYMMYACVFV